jgi:hypothetical protein
LKGELIMAKFCDFDCHAVCDFCKNYLDDSQTDGFNLDEFEGEGLCKIKNIRTDAGSGYGCDDFECCTLD